MKILITLAAFLFLLACVIIARSRPKKKVAPVKKLPLLIQQHEDYTSIATQIEKCNNHQQLGFCLGKISDFDEKYGNLTSGAADVILLTELCQFTAAQFETQSYCTPQVFPEFSKLFN